MNYNQIYINGSWQDSASTERIEVVNPTTEEVITTIAAGSAQDVDDAVAAARAAFPGWAATEPAERGRLLNKVHQGLAARREEIATLVSEEVGMPYSQALGWQADLPIDNFRFYADLAGSYSFDGGTVRHSLVVKEPVGVVGCVTPWNYPLHQIALKVAPALAAGCTVVLKPSEVAPRTGLLLAEVMDEAGIPDGVFNVVSGSGQPVGEAIASHPEIDMVSFTGSTRAGTRISELAAPTIKRVALELGGKSANVLLEDLTDAELEAAVTDGITNCYFNAGQTCTALTRMLVPSSRLDRVNEIAARVAPTFTPGDPFSDETTLGPVVNKSQYDHVVSMIDNAVTEGATLLTGGTDKVTDHGYFVAPTVFSSVSRNMRIGRDEVFGPVLAIIPYKDEEEAVELANDSDYGLSGGVWSTSEDHAIQVAKRIRTGQIGVNGGGFNIEAPFGGYKKSGNGREAGVWGLEEYLEIKAIHRAQSDEDRAPTVFPA